MEENKGIIKNEALDEIEMDAETYNYLHGTGRDADGMMNPNYYEEE